MRMYQGRLGTQLSVQFEYDFLWVDIDVHSKTLVVSTPVGLKETGLNRGGNFIIVLKYRVKLQTGL